MAGTSIVDLVRNVADFHLFKWHIFTITLALGGRHRYGFGVQCFGWNAHAASVVGFGLSLVLVDFLISSHASLGLAFAIGFGFDDLPCSLLA